MNQTLAQINITEKFFGANNPNQSPWWVTLCNSLARCDAGPGTLISTLLPNILVLAGIIFFALILLGGFGMIVGAGHEANPQSAAKSKAAVTYGLIGFLLVISAFFVLQIINTITGINFINPPI